MDQQVHESRVWVVAFLAIALAMILIGGVWLAFGPPVS
jgi:hypothetical protein